MLRVKFLGKDSRVGRRRDGSEAVFHNVAVLVEGVGVGSLGVTEEAWSALEGVPFGTELEVEAEARVWNGRVELKPGRLVPARNGKAG